MDSGMIFTQSGVPIQGSADYQKVIDSRWRFMEIEEERDIAFNLPVVAGVATLADRYFEKTILFTHGLNFIPLFEVSIPGEADGGVDIFADEKNVFARRLIDTTGRTAASFSGRLRVYNLPILTDYVAPKEFVVGSSSPQSDIGIEFLEDSGGVDLGDASPVGFSADTRKKILSIHRHGLAAINDYAGHQAQATAVDAATDILTIGAEPGAPYGGDISWCSTLGQAISYSPNDFVTYPGGLGPGVFYIIPQDSTHIKLAGSYADALAGVAINLTSAGSLPGHLNAAANPSLRENAIFHDIGYPPTFLLARVNSQDAFFALPETQVYIGPLLYQPPTLITADSQYLNFLSVQAQFTGKFGYVILKDPVEIAS